MKQEGLSIRDVHQFCPSIPRTLAARTSGDMLYTFPRSIFPLWSLTHKRSGAGLSHPPKANIYHHLSRSKASKKLCLPYTQSLNAALCSKDNSKGISISIPLFQSQTGSTILLQEFLRLVDLAGEVRATSSIGMVREHQASMVLADLLLGKRAFAEVEDQAGFPLVHLGLEAAFVEWSAECVESIGVPVSSEGYQSGSSL